jgi:hypothetical protein
MPRDKPDPSHLSELREEKVPVHVGAVPLHVPGCALPPHVRVAKPAERAKPALQVAEATLPKACELVYA